MPLQQGMGGPPVPRPWLCGVLSAISLAGVVPAASAADDTAPGAEVQCPTGTAVTSGPPSSELFDDHPRFKVHAVWCERYADDGGQATRHGPYVDYYPGGALRARANFVNDVLEGPFVSHHESGLVWTRGTFLHGHLEGRYQMWNPSGSRWMEGQFRQGELDGVYLTWHENGSRASETSYRNGIEDGISRIWYVNGQTKVSLRAVDGVWSGPFQRWHPNGRPSEQGAYARCPPERSDVASCATLGAAPHGPWKYWHESGVLAREGSWQLGRRAGSWSYWDDHGKPVMVEQYVDGVLAGVDGRPTGPVPASPGLPDGALD